MVSFEKDHKGGNRILRVLWEKMITNMKRKARLECHEGDMDGLGAQRRFAMVIVEPETHGE